MAGHLCRICGKFDVLPGRTDDEGPFCRNCGEGGSLLTPTEGAVCTGTSIFFFDRDKPGLAAYIHFPFGRIEKKWGLWTSPAWSLGREEWNAVVQAAPHGPGAVASLVHDLGLEYDIYPFYYIAGDPLEDWDFRVTGVLARVGDPWPRIAVLRKLNVIS